MKILQLNIEGFRSLKNVEWKPGDLNVVIGANASGKSNLLKALEFISASARGKLADTIQRMGGMQLLAWDGQANRIVFDLVTSFPKTELDDAGTAHYRFGFGNTGPLSYPEIAGEYLYRRVPNPEGRGGTETFDRSILDRTPPRTLKVFDDGNPSQLAAGIDFDTKIGDVDPSETFLSLTNRLFANSAAMLKNDLEHWAIFLPFLTHDTAVVRQPPIVRHELHLDRDGQNLVNVLNTLYNGNRQFEEAVDDAFGAAYGSDYQKLVFSPLDQRVQIRVRWRSLKQDQTSLQISDGTLKFLLLIAALADPAPPPLIAIDEPETGLHPRMFGIIAEYAVEAARKTQVIFTTHSPEFLDAFTDTKPTTTVAQWIDGETRLAIPDQDRLNHWLKDFTLGEMFLSHDLENLVEV